MMNTTGHIGARRYQTEMFISTQPREECRLSWEAYL